MHLLKNASRPSNVTILRHAAVLANGAARDARDIDGLKPRGQNERQRVSRSKSKREPISLLPGPTRP
jgi:hypothetical protein